MPIRGFCEHGKVWTTCPVCGKEVIAAAGKKGGSLDEFGEFQKKPKKVKPIPEEPSEEPAEEESGGAEA